MDMVIPTLRRNAVGAGLYGFGRATAMPDLITIELRGATDFAAVVTAA